MLYPIIPDTIEKTLKIFNLNPADIDLQSIATHNYLKSGNDLHKIGILFKKIEKKND
jgi:methionyl-tRNA synthetase